MYIFCSVDRISLLLLFLFFFLLCFSSSSVFTALSYSVCPLRQFWSSYNQYQCWLSCYLHAKYVCHSFRPATIQRWNMGLNGLFNEMCAMISVRSVLTACLWRRGYWRVEMAQAFIRGKDCMQKFLTCHDWLMPGIEHRIIDQFHRKVQQIGQWGHAG